jgi:hypothetical protein
MTAKRVIKGRKKEKRKKNLGDFAPKTTFYISTSAQQVVQRQQDDGQIGPYLNNNVFSYIPNPFKT